MGRREGGGGELSSRTVSKALVIKSSLMRLPMNRNDNETSDELQVCVFYLTGIYISSVVLLHNKPKSYNKRRYRKNE